MIQTLDEFIFDYFNEKYPEEMRTLLAEYSEYNFMAEFKDQSVGFSCQ